MAAIEAAPSHDLINHRPRKLSRLIKELNQRLEEYPGTYLFYFKSGREWVFDDDVISGKHFAGESIVIRCAIRLARAKLLNRVQECRCGMWFYAKFKHQHFCSGRCRKKHYESSETFKSERRDYMRRYYRLKTSGKVR
jgi:hypothetical protein